MREKIVNLINDATLLYHRLVLVVGPAGSGKSRALQEVNQHDGMPIINVNLELSKRMLDLTTRQRALNVARLLEDLVRSVNAETVLLDNIELLFDVTLKSDPLHLLQNLSRSRSIVAAWNGAIEDGRLIYAVPQHPEHRRYPLDGLLVATLGEKA
jgi:ABC-type uncharacterized transport system ATPase component